MMKFFRKYNKHLLAVFMAFLMVVFVGGSALQGMLTPSGDQTIATSRYGKITSGDQRDARATTELLDSIGGGINWRQPTQHSVRPLELVDWILLSREVRALGIVPDHMSAQSLFSTRGDNDPVLNLSRVLHTRPEYILDSLQQVQSVQMADSMMETATVAGAAEIRHEADRILSTVSVNAVVLPARAFVDDGAKFSEKRIQDHWELYKDVEPGEGLSFGYFQPISVKVQYIKIDSKVLAENMGVANLEREARRFYEDNKTINYQFSRPIENPSDEDESKDAQSSQKPYLSWEEAREIAVEIIRDEQAESLSGRIADWLLQYASFSVATAERGDNGYLKIPDAVTSKSFLSEISSKLPVSLSFPSAIHIEETDYVSVQDVYKLEGLGRAIAQVGSGQFLSLSDLISMSQPFIPDITSTALDRKINVYNFYALFQVMPYALKDAGGNHYVLRIIDSKPAQVADSIDLCREQVIKDLRLLEGYQIAKGLAETLMEDDEDYSLKQALDANQELSDYIAAETGVAYTSSGPVVRLREGQLTHSTYLAPGRSAGGLGRVTEDIVQSWFELEFALRPRMIQEFPDSKRILVVEWKETSTATEADLETKREKIADGLSARRGYGAITDWLTPDNIRARAEFKQVSR